MQVSVLGIDLGKNVCSVVGLAGPVRWLCVDERNARNSLIGLAAKLPPRTRGNAPTMRFVELKSQDQLDVQTLHRSRDRLVGERTALINQLRAILLERGLVAPKGKRNLERFLVVLMDEHGGAELSRRMIVLVADVRAQWAELDGKIAVFDAEFICWTKENEDAGRLTTNSRRRADDRFGADRGGWQGRCV